MEALYVKRVDAVGATADSAVDANGLLDRLPQEDTTAFWDVWERYRSTVLWRSCLRWMGGNHEDAEDALSSACIRARKYFPAHVHAVTNTRAWLTRLLYNHCMTLLKTDQNRRYRIQSILDPTTIADASANNPQESAEDMLVQREMRAYIRGRINELPSRLREPLILYFFQDMSQQDIAGYLNLSPENVRKRLQQGRDILRVQLAPYLGKAEMKGDSCL